MAAIFISHRSRDDTAASDIRAWLTSQGHRSLFLDFDPEWGIRAGRNWEQELYRQLQSNRAVIVLCSEASMTSRWCFGGGEPASGPTHDSPSTEGSAQPVEHTQVTAEVGVEVAPTGARQQGAVRRRDGPAHVDEHGSVSGSGSH